MESTCFPEKAQSTNIKATAQTHASAKIVVAFPCIPPNPVVTADF
jgi:hypothetical protein